MPLRDALRTSVLSKKWRYCWASIPKLVFDEKLIPIYSNNKKIDRYKLVNAILHILLLHKGPILEFVVCMADATIFNEFDNIILHLSRSNNVKKFIFEIWSPKRRYKLPSLFFSLHGLEHIDLKDCVFELPLMCNGFSMLKNLRFHDVDFTTKTLLRFLANCPLLEEFTLIGDQTHFIENKYTFVELFECLPSVKVLEISNHHNKRLTVGGMPHKLPTSLINLKILVLDVCFHELSSILCVINSSPNLEKIKLEMCKKHILYARPNFKNFLGFQEYSGINLDHLKELDITHWYISAPEMAFVKIIMANSLVLKIARIKLDASVSVDGEVEMFRELVLLPFPRGPNSKFVVERPKILPVNDDDV